MNNDELSAFSDFDEPRSFEALWRVGLGREMPRRRLQYSRFNTPYMWLLASSNPLAFLACPEGKAAARGRPHPRSRENLPRRSSFGIIRQGGVMTAVVGVACEPFPPRVWNNYHSLDAQTCRKSRTPWKH